MKSVIRLACVLLALCAPKAGEAAPILVDFESLDDFALVGESIPGLTFSNATVLTAGISVNEFDFPPASGVRIAFDDGGPMRVDFSAPVFDVAGYFTYASQVTLTAFDVAGNSLAAVISGFSANYGSGGEAGSAPNELLRLMSAVGIGHVTIAGDPLGGSFTLDDFQYDASAPTSPAPAPVPEPATLLMFATGAAGLFAKRLRQRQARCG